MTAPWAARSGHTTVIDAAGVIYVIGGEGLNGIYRTTFKDVWVSTDGGAQPDSRGGRGVWLGTQRVLGGYYRVLEGQSRDIQGVRNRLTHPRHSFQTFTRVALPPSHDI
jgi:hypothetical protein